MKNILLIIIGRFFFCCKQKPVEEKYAVPTYKTGALAPSRHAVFQKNIQQNNTPQFEMLAGDLDLALQYDELLRYSIKIANRNNTPVVYNNIYTVLTTPSDGTPFKPRCENKKFRFMPLN